MLKCTSYAFAAGYALSLYKPNITINSHSYIPSFILKG